VLGSDEVGARSCEHGRRCQRLALESHHRRSACRKSLQRSRTRGRDDGVTGAQPSRCSAARGCELGFSGVPSGRGWRRTRRRRAGGNGKRQYVAATRGGGTALLAPAPDADADARLDKTNPPSRKDTEQDKSRCLHLSSTDDWTNPSSSFLSPRCEIPVPFRCLSSFTTHPTTKPPPFLRFFFARSLSPPRKGRFLWSWLASRNSAKIRICRFISGTTGGALMFDDTVRWRR
jgi:hypothetical protein